MNMEQTDPETARDQSQNKTQPENSGSREVNTDFMKERIKARPINRKRLARRTVVTALLAVMFGVIACVVFLVLEPLISRALSASRQPESVLVTFPEEAAEDEMSPEDMVADDRQMQEEEMQQAAEAAAQQAAESAAQQAAEAAAEQAAQQAATAAIDREAIRKSVLETLQNDTSTTDLYRQEYVVLSEVAARAARSMVTVTGITSDYDWAGDLFENSGKTSGLIIAEAGEELFIVVRNKDLAGSESILVTFADGSQAGAVIRAEDTVTGFVVLAVDEANMETKPEENDKIAVAALGSSARNNLLGQPVIAVGAPSGTQGSVSYGIVTNAALPLDVTDSCYLQMTTDIYGSTVASGALVDLEGNVIGMMDLTHNSPDSANLISAIGITEIKSLFEDLSNQKQEGFLGVHATDVPDRISEEQGVPKGAYVMQIELDSPAMSSGIQSGDVITRYNSTEITGYRELAAAIQEGGADRPIHMTIMRRGSEGYEEVNLTAQTTARLLIPQ